MVFKRRKVIYKVKLLMEKKIEYCLETHIISFIWVLGKAYDRIKKKKLFEVFNDEGIKIKVYRMTLKYEYEFEIDS